MQRKDVSPSRAVGGSFLSSAARTLGDFPLLISAEEAREVLATLAPTEKVWLSLEHVRLPQSSSSAAAAAGAPPSAAAGGRDVADYYQQQQQQQQRRSDIYQNAGSSSSSAIVTSPPQPVTAYDAFRSAVTPPRPLVRRALGPRELDKVQQQTDEQWRDDGSTTNSGGGTPREPWNASIKPERDTQGRFLPVVSSPDQLPEHNPHHQSQQQKNNGGVADAADADDVGQQHRSVGDIETTIVPPRVLHHHSQQQHQQYRHQQHQQRSLGSPSDPQQRGPAHNYASSPTMGGDPVRVFRFDPNEFDSNAPTQQPSARSHVHDDEQGDDGHHSSRADVPAGRVIVSPPRAAGGGGILMNRLRAAVTQKQQRREVSSPSRGGGFDDVVHHSSNNNDPQIDDHHQHHHHHLFANNRRSSPSADQRHPPTYQQPPPPDLPVSMNRSMLLRRDSSLKRVSAPRAAVVSPGRKRGAGNNQSSGRSVQQNRPNKDGSRNNNHNTISQHRGKKDPYAHVKSTIHVSRETANVTVPMRPGADPFFFSTAQHFGHVSPAREVAGMGQSSPAYDDRRGRRGIAWVV